MCISLINIILVVLMTSACGGVCKSFHKEKHPDDIEQQNIAVLSSGVCDGVDLINPDTLFSEPFKLSENLPEAGIEVALDAIPKPTLICTQKAVCSCGKCDWECADNNCGYIDGCAYEIVTSDYNRICLARDTFECGGTDCSPWCHPFSTQPQNTYRFVGKIRYEDSSYAYIDVTAFCKYE